MSDITGQIIADRYQVQQLIGRGGMAEVYKVWDNQKNANFAIKVLHADLAEDKIFLKRFEREATALEDLQHPNIIRFYGLERVETLSFMVMDFVQGDTLRKKIFLTDEAQSHNDVLNIFEPVCSGLSYAHTLGRVHCDIKPANIMISDFGQVLLMDFGISRLTDASTATLVGAGTPAYMAPEQARGEDPCPETDIYALGVILYEMLTGGQRPFTGNLATITGSTRIKILWEQINTDPPCPRQYNPEISVGLETVVLKCLRKEPTERYSSAMALLTDLKRNLDAVLPETPLDQPVRIDQIPILEESLGETTPFEDVQTSVLEDESELTPIIMPEIFPDDPAVVSSTQEPKSKSFLSKPGIWLGSAGFIVLLILCTAAVVVGTVLLNQNKDDRDTSAVTQIVSGQTREATEEFISVSSTPRNTLDSEVVGTETPTQKFSVTPDINPTTTLGIGSTFIRETDDMVMVYVPGGEFQMGSNDSDSFDNESPEHTVYLNSYWIDKYEVNSTQFSEFLNETLNQNNENLIYIGSQTNINIVGGQALPDSGFENHPINYVTWEGAAAYCEWSGGRLPTEAEWEKAARGIDSWVYPWGNSFSGTNLNFCDANCSQEWKDSSVNDGYAETAPVGNFPGGSSPYGAEDMSGNVWEWVSDWYDADYYYSSPYKSPDGPTSGDTHIVRGGSYLNYDLYLRTTNRFNTTNINKRVDFGFRCVYPINEENILSETDVFNQTKVETPPQQPTETPIPASQTPTQTPLSELSIGSSIIRELDAMEMMYIPGGTFTMGSPSTSSNAYPPHEVNLDAYWMDKYEVSNDQYAAFLNANGNQSEGDGTISVTWYNTNNANISLVGSKYVSDTNYGNHPVMNVSWFGAAAYCEWVGGRLPTEAEWEYAAMGGENRIFAWGDKYWDGIQTNACDSNCPYDHRDDSVNDGYAYTAPVTAYPAGVSAFGQYNLTGNVAEWVLDDYSTDFYSSGITDNPVNITNSRTKVNRGGGWVSLVTDLYNTLRCSQYSTNRYLTVGFRCVVEFDQ